MSTIGSQAFDKLRDHIHRDHDVKREVEFAFASEPRKPASSDVEQILRLSELRQSGDISEGQFRKLVAKITED